jgi:glycosyltransferase involved in cell wall biosynthesis
MVRTIVVCEVQVPFVHGGAEIHVRSLVAQLHARGYETDRVSLPFKWYPKDEILTHAAAWRLVDLSEANGRAIDRVIATKFPAYFVRHPHKVTWLMHQYRAAYELAGTEYSDFEHVETDVALRRQLVALDTQMLGESHRIFAGAANAGRRLEKYNGLSAETLYHPPLLAGRLHGGPSGDYVLVVSRLETIKRVDLVVEAMTMVRHGVRLVVAGHGTQRANVTARAETLGVSDRVHFAGAVDDDTLIELYAGALAVVFAPFDEDFGYVTLESFLARKPVITATDAGGPLEFVEDDTNGAICEPTPAAIAAAIDRYAAEPARAASHGDAGYERARLITWEGVIERLLAE